MLLFKLILDPVLYFGTMDEETGPRQKTKPEGASSDESRHENGGGGRSRNAFRAHPAALSRSVDIGGAAASTAPRCHQGRVRSPRPGGHQFRAGASPLQYRRQGADRGRAAHARLLSRVERV